MVKFKNENTEDHLNCLGANLQWKTLNDMEFWSVMSMECIAATIKNVEPGIENTRWKLPARAHTPMVSSHLLELDGTPNWNPRTCCCAVQSMQGLEDDERVSFQYAELRPCCYADFLVGLGLEAGAVDVGGPGLDSAELH
jgi:hypothetical protein